jgi:hypothetical protein
MIDPQTGNVQWYDPEDLRVRQTPGESIARNAPITRQRAETNAQSRYLRADQWLTEQ